MATTCQICGREIKANTGLIAHHGYRRQWVGFQSASCRGARHVPYEVGKDALESEIEILEGWLKGVRGRIIELEENPPATLSRWRLRGVGRGGETIEYPKPEGFDRNDRYARSEYACLYRDKWRELLRDLDWGKQELERLEGRLLAWYDAHPE